MNQLVRLFATIPVLMTCGICCAGEGDVVLSVDPFEGEFSEGFEDVAPGFYSPLEIFIGDPSVAGGEANALLTPSFITTGSSFLGSTIVGHESAQFSHSTGPIEIQFLTPTRMFGGYFATNGGSNGGLVEFFDAGDNLIASTPLDVTFMTGLAPYTWNGWQSEIAFSKVRIQTNGTGNGFLGIDDLEMSIIPAPGAAMLLVVAGVGRVIRRRR